MATVIFSGQVLSDVIRVVDFGIGAAPRIVVEQQQPADAMGGHGWSRMEPIPGRTLEALLIAAHVVPV